VLLRCSHVQFKSFLKSQVGNGQPTHLNLAFISAPTNLYEPQTLFCYRTAPRRHGICHSVLNSGDRGISQPPRDACCWGRKLQRAMLSSAPCSSSDLTFFSPSKSTKSGSTPITPVTVTTRLTRRAFPSQSRSCTTSSSAPSARSSPVSNPPLKHPRKRKFIYPEVPSIPVSSSELPPAVKRLRTNAPKEKVSGRNSSSSKNSSRASSHRLSSPEPIYRSDRSRSISLLHSNDSVANFSSRRWVTDELGTPGENHLSSEAVVKQLIKTYKACELSYSHHKHHVDLAADFTNPDDPKDMSFKPHHHPMVELEYPNQGASERFLLFLHSFSDLLITFCLDSSSLLRRIKTIITLSWT